MKIAVRFTTPRNMLTPDADEWPEAANVVYCRLLEHIENEIINERWLA